MRILNENQINIVSGGRMAFTCGYGLKNEEEIKLNVVCSMNDCNYLACTPMNTDAQYANVSVLFDGGQPSWISCDPSNPPKRSRMTFIGMGDIPDDRDESFCDLKSELDL